MTFRGPIRVAILSLLLCASAAPGLGAEMFEGRTVTILSSGTPGGGYDAFARMLADGIKTGNPVTYVAPEQIAQVMQRAYSTRPELLQQLQQALK